MKVNINDAELTQIISSIVQSIRDSLVQGTVVQIDVWNHHDGDPPIEPKGNPVGLIFDIILDLNPDQPGFNRNQSRGQWL
jgi:hypothetical protein